MSLNRSSDSPVSAEEDDTVMPPLSSRSLIAPERSSANWATRWMAEEMSSRAHGDELVVVARQNGLEVRELSGQLARCENALANAEE